MCLGRAGVFVFNLALLSMFHLLSLHLLSVGRWII